MFFASRTRARRIGPLLALALGVLTLLPAHTLAQVSDLRTAFRTIETEHFWIHYHEPLSVGARRVALILERAHEELTEILGYRPKRRVHVVITDGTEFANGSATAIPVNTVRLFMTAPEDLSEIGDFDDWVNLLVVHEHAHILHLDNIGGLPALLNKIIGKVWAPNHILPRFIVEGLATYLESERTSGGRMRSTHFAMIMRMAALEGRLLRLDQLSNQTDYHPHGSVFYLYGSRFWDFIIEKHGHDVLARFAEFYGKKAIPFGFNRALKRVTGESFVGLYEDFLERERQKARAVEARVMEEGRIEGERLTHHGEGAAYPVFLDDMTLVYYSADGRSDAQLRRIDLRDPSRTKKLTRVSGRARAALAPDGSLYFDTVDSARNLYSFFDLYRLGPQKKRRQRLTRGLRARAPAVSPDGTKLAFTLNSAGTTHLAIAPIDEPEAYEILVRSERFEQVYTPAFSPDGHTLVYSIYRRGGYRDLEELDLETRTRRRLMRDRALDMGPAFSPDGRFLYFSSDRDGVANIYRMDRATGRTVKITNVVGGAYMPAVSPDGSKLAYIGYGSLGFDVYLLDLSDHEPLDAPESYERPEARLIDDYAALFSERYRAIRTLFPRNVMLNVGSHVLGYQLGITLRAEDIAQHHVLSLRSGIGLEMGFADVELVYALRRFPVPLTLSLYRLHGIEGGLVVDRARSVYRTVYLGGEIGLSYRFYDSFRTHSLSANFGLQHTDANEELAIPRDPNRFVDARPRFGFTSSTRFRYAYSDVRQHTYDITPSEGQRVSADLSVRSPQRGARGTSGSAVLTLDRYIENPFVEHHVLAVGLQAGTVFGDPDYRGRFSLGGFPNMNLLDGFLNGQMLSGRVLRGYPVGATFGERFMLLNLDYRFPIHRIQRGIHTLPFYLQRIYGSVFANFGEAFDGAPSLQGILGGAGVELFLDLLLGYYLPFTIRGGLAYGWNEGGGFSGYLNLGLPF